MQSFLIALGLATVACSRHDAALDHAMYMLLDTSGTYAEELSQAQRIINFTLTRLRPGDTFAVARIDTASFSEKDILYRKTFDTRPSTSNNEKRAFRDQIDAVLKQVKPSTHTDITGGLLQAVEFLNETGAGRKTILVFSDLKEDLPRGFVRDIPLQLSGMRVFAVNVTKLRSDNVDPREYLDRVETWQRRVQEGGGEWKMINDLDHLEPIFSE
jgi:hypothetical protein